MQGGSGFNSITGTAPLDKSRVLDVKPLRSLKPIFTTSQEAPPYVCATPDGPFPPGYSPFYPFRAPLPPHPPPVAMAPIRAPIRAIRTPESADNVMEMVNGDEEVADDGPAGGRRRSTRSFSAKIDRSKKYQAVAPRADYVPPITSFEREEVARK